MLHNGKDYDVIWLTEEDYLKIDNKPHCDRFSKKTLLVNQTTLDYYYCGELTCKPGQGIFTDLKVELEKNRDK